MQDPHFAPFPRVRKSEAGGHRRGVGISRERRAKARQRVVNAFPVFDRRVGSGYEPTIRERTLRSRNASQNSFKPKLSGIFAFGVCLCKQLEGSVEDRVKALTLPELHVETPFLFGKIRAPDHAEILHKSIATTSWSTIDGIVSVTTPFDSWTRGACPLTSN